MRVSVQCFGALRDYLPDDASGNVAELELSEGATVDVLVDALNAPRGLVHSLLVNDEPSRSDRGLSEGDRVTLMPQFTGGSRT